MIRATFTSNHVEPDRGETLRVRIQRDGGVPRYQRDITVHFAVPDDFHSHNDSVAAALMALLGKQPSVVRFNFPISERCAALLRAYYALDDIGPVDPGLEPRRPGRYLGMNFSGGLDSSALRAVLDRLLPGGFRVISSDFVGVLTHEQAAMDAWPPDVRCRTDIRARGLFTGRYITAVPLLFADYLDLYGLTAAHVFSQDATAIERNIDGHRPAFLDKALTLQAGGLEEVHLFRGIDEVGVLRILMRLVPERLEAAVRASSHPGTLRNISRRLALRILYEQDRAPMPPFVAETLLTTKPDSPGAMFAGGVPILYVIRHYGEAGARALSYGDIDMTRIDWSFLSGLSLEFAAKYNTNFVEYIPASLRGRLLTLLASVGVEPYTERDWIELETVRRVMLPIAAAMGIAGLPLPE